MRLKRTLLLAAGFVMLAFGTIGLFLPVWPTTPFVLVAAACFAHNPRIYARMLKIPLFREYIESYREGKGLSKRTVTKSLTLLWGMLALSAFLLKSIWAAVGLAAVGAAVTAHILSIAKPKKE